MPIKLTVLLFLIFSTVSFSAYKPKELTTIQLQKNYVAALMSYEGRTYGSGGVVRGINCSSLARRALVDTVGIEEEARSNIAAHPCLTEQLRQGCGGRLSDVLQSANLNNLDYGKIQLGDIGIVGDKIGWHTLAYVGNKTWIHADPLSGKVIESKAPNESYWFTLETSVMRWNALKGGE